MVINTAIRGQGGVTDFLHQDGAGNSLHIIDYAKLHVLRLMLVVSAALMKWVKKTNFRLAVIRHPGSAVPGEPGEASSALRARACDSWI